LCKLQSFKVSSILETCAALVVSLDVSHLMYTASIIHYSAEEGRHAIVPLDASIVDIYKDSHAVIFMINPFERQSLQYVRYIKLAGYL